MPATYDIVYDENADLFYNDKYLEVLKEKDYVLKLKSISAEDVKYEIVEKDAKQERKKPTISDHIDRNNEIAQIIIFAHFKHMMSITKYMKPHPNYDDMPISVNYILRKYCRIKQHKKNILVIHDAVFSANRFFERDGTLIDALSLYFLENATKCNIYSVFSHPLSKNYERIVTNDANGNTYHMVTNDNNGDILDRNIFSTIRDRLANNVFDVIYFRAFIVNMTYNKILAYMHIIARLIDKHTQILYYMNVNQFKNNHDKILNILLQMFGDVSMVKDKFLGASYPALYLMCSGFMNDSRICEPLERIVDNGNIFEKNIRISNDVDIGDINHYIETIQKAMLRRSHILLQLVRYNEPIYKKMFTIVVERINIKQRALAYRAKYAKYKI